MIIAIYLLIGFVLTGIVIKSGVMEEIIQDEEGLDRNTVAIMYSVIYTVGWPLVVFVVIVLWKKL